MLHTPEEVWTVEASLLATRGSGLRPRVIIDRKSGAVLDGALVRDLATKHGLEVETIHIDVDDAAETQMRLMFARRHPGELARAIEVVRELHASISAAARKRHGKNVATLQRSGQRSGRACEILAEIACCSPRTISSAVRILKADDPNLVESVLSGKVPVNTAVAYAGRSPEQRRSLLESHRDRNVRITPRKVIDPVRAAAGGQFDLDPATTSTNPIGAKSSYALERGEDGLLKSWVQDSSGSRIYSIWINPPYDDTAPWVSKSIDVVATHPDIAIWMLLPATTFGTPSGQLLAQAVQMLYLRDRVQFLTGDLVPLLGSADQGSILLAFGAARLDTLVPVLGDTIWTPSRGAA